MYGKIFESIYTGSLYGKTEALCMMQAMIVFADEDGFVDMSFRAIVGRTGFGEEFVRIGLTELMQPDPISRTEGEEGRRILPVTPCHAETPENVNGFVLVNHSKYRDIAKREDSRTAARDRQRKSRDERRKNTGETAQNNAASQSVTPCHNPSQNVTTSEADTDTETETENNPLSPPSGETDVSKKPRRKLKRPDPKRVELPLGGLFPEAWLEWCDHRAQRARQPLTEPALRRQLEELAQWGEVRAVRAIRHSIAKNWQSIYEPPDKRAGPDPEDQNRLKRERNKRRAAERRGEADEARSEAERKNEHDRLLREMETQHG